MSSILTDIKKMFGIIEEDTSFDTDLIININSAFSVLNQLGVGPDGGYKISDKNDNWEDFIPDGDDRLEMVKTYIYLKVKLMFDTATMTTPLIEVIKHQIAEFEWRLNVAVDPEA